ncbi:MAG TPA: glycosyltransferase, partial [Sporichthyaceae bacterium]
GHILPTVAVAEALTARGHQVAWAGNSTYLGGVLPTGRTVFAVDDEFPGEPLSARLVRWRGLRAATAFRFFWEDFLIPLAHSMVPGVRTAVDEFAPDVVLADQQALAGALVARERKLPWATSATTTAELTGQYETMPKLGLWAQDQLAELQGTYDVTDPVDLRFSDQLVLAYSSVALLNPPSPPAEHIAFVGPAFGGRGAPAPFDWAWLDPDRRQVLVSLGTVNQDSGDRFFAVAAEAFAALADSVQAIFVMPPGTAVDLPPNVLAAARVPQLELLPHLHAVIFHGGHNTMCEALAHGLPLVVAPIRDDQPANAAQIEQAHAGVRVKFGRVSAGELQDAVLAVLDDPSYAAGAAHIRDSFAAAGGADAAAARLEALA